MSDEVIEGFYEGKALERILKKAELEKIEAELGEHKSIASAAYNQTQRKMQETQEKLKELNDDFYSTKNKLDKLRDGARIELDPKEIRDVNQDVKDVVKLYFAEKPEDEVQVHVHFHSTEEGNQGLSTDATFTVPTRANFSSLAVQVAKYWGLDSGEIFFLDRDGRVVPDEMHIQDVVIPEQPAEFMVSEWQYRVTVVRCGTLLHVEDPNATDETLNDFTFSQNELQKELDEDRAHLGIKVSGMAGDEKLKIPSLLELKAIGEKKLRRMRFDVLCRTIEVAIFLVIFMLFLVQFDADNKWLHSMQRIQLAIDDEFNEPFESPRGPLTCGRDADQRCPGTGRRLNFSEIHEPAEFKDWVITRMRDTVGDEGALQARGLYLIGDVMVRTYDYDDPCPPPAPPAPPEPKVAHWLNDPNLSANWSVPFNGSDAFGNDTCVYAQDGYCDYPCGGGPEFGPCDVGCALGCACEYKSDCSDCGDCTPAPTPAPVIEWVGGVNGTNVTRHWTPPPDVEDLAAAAEQQFQEEYCKCNPVAMQIFRVTQKAPKCVDPRITNIMQVIAQQFLTGQAFSIFDGKVSAYADGQLSYLRMNASAEAAEAEWFAENPLEKSTVRAVRMMTLVYAASVEGLIAVSVTMETTAGGMIIPSINLQIIDLRRMPTEDVILYGVLVTLSAVIFIMEVRRYLCPENEDEAERPSIWWIVHFSVPLMIAGAFGIKKASAGQNIESMLFELITEKRNMDHMGSLFSYAYYDFYWIITMVVTLFLLNALFFRYALSYFQQLKVLTTTVTRLFMFLVCVIVLTVLVMGCFAFILYAMFNSVSPFYRTPTRAMLAAVSFSHGSFAEHADLMENFHGSWLALMLVAWLFLGIIFKNVTVAIFASFLRDWMLRCNYQYHPFWAHKSQATYNPYEIKERKKFGT